MKFLWIGSPLAVALVWQGLAPSAQAANVQLRITVENLSPANSVSLAPFRFGFGDGTFDAFNAGSAAFLLGQPDIASAPIVSIAEGGSGATWLPGFQAAEPAANVDSLTGPAGPFLPGQSNSAVFTVDTSNRFFTFGTMVVPSNDHFLGNDDPMEYEVFDANGALRLTTIEQGVDEIWDAGSETENPANAAFLPGIGVNAQRENENSVVQFNFTDLSAFNGLATAGGYNFDSSLLTATSPLLRVSFEVVPEPATALLAAFATVGVLVRRR
ncbi:hypothetical protein Pla108_32700 [Botrimarina colliarenosi]|uniref:PEP-CTERM protein-sorting domain-containing protein n=1 Tax=Botrimarina colliarenosi TaxID=2528001 RepID=A0A5C6A837_9BACT|nr:spondin domain-containing protein [Botrimarina colliarenosi]TWT96182.1 hypothetical protein Pla108_32700 [Botrimarina colliarenosi]